MRTKKEIERAIGHIRETTEEAKARGPKYMVHINEIVEDVLQWVLGHPSRFQVMVMEPCDKLDAHKNN